MSIQNPEVIQSISVDDVTAGIEDQSSSNLGQMKTNKYSCANALGVTMISKAHFETNKSQLCVMQQQDIERENKLKDTVSKLLSCEKARRSNEKLLAEKETELSVAQAERDELKEKDDSAMVAMEGRLTEMFTAALSEEKTQREVLEDRVKVLEGVLAAIASAFQT